MGRIRKRYRAIVRRAVVSPPTSSPSDDDSRQEDANDNLANSFEDLDVPHMNTPTASLQLGNEPTKEGVCIDALFTQTRLYQVARPLIQLIKSNLDGLIARSYGGKSITLNSWGTERKAQFLDHVFDRIKSIYHVDNSGSSLTAMDSQMVESAAAYIAALSKDGRNFTGNEYVKQHVIEALIPENVSSVRAISRRLEVNRQLLPKLIEKRRKFNDISNSATSNSSSRETEDDLDDNALAEQEGSFSANLLPDELGFLHLFPDLDVGPDDDFYFEQDDRPPVVHEDAAPARKKKKSVNLYNDHLKPTVRKKRKDCPKYIDVVRAFGHSIFRIDTFARKKVMVPNDNGEFEMHLQHIQSKAISEAHRSFKQSEIYHDWQHENRWLRKIARQDGDGYDEIIVKPTIGLRLFFYAMCPCCKDPTQRDCADSLVVGFTHLLSGLGKIRMSDYQDKKTLIASCDCEYHSKSVNKNMWKSTSDFMTAMLCAPKVYEEFENPELSKYSTQVF